MTSEPPWSPHVLNLPNCPLKPGVTFHKSHTPFPMDDLLVPHQNWHIGHPHVGDLLHLTTSLHDSNYRTASKVLMLRCFFSIGITRSATWPILVLMSVHTGVGAFGAIERRKTTPDSPLEKGSKLWCPVWRYVAWIALEDKAKMWKITHLIGFAHLSAISRFPRGEGIFFGFPWKVWKHWKQSWQDGIRGIECACHIRVRWVRFGILL